MPKKNDILHKDYPVLRSNSDRNMLLRNLTLQGVREIRAGLRDIVIRRQKPCFSLRQLSLSGGLAHERLQRLRFFFKLSFVSSRE